MFPSALDSISPMSPYYRQQDEIATCHRCMADHKEKFMIEIRGWHYCQDCIADMEECGMTDYETEIFEIEKH